MGKLGMIILAVGLFGCSSSNNPPPGGPGPSTYSLPGIGAVSIPPGSCIIVNAQPQSLPAATVSYTVNDAVSSYVDAYEVGVVLSSNTCNFNPADSVIDDMFTGSASDSGTVVAGDWDLDVICLNTANDCLLDSATWTATY